MSHSLEQEQLRPPGEGSGLPILSVFLLLGLGIGACLGQGLAWQQSLGLQAERQRLEGEARQRSELDAEWRTLSARVGSEVRALHTEEIELQSRLQQTREDLKRESAGLAEARQALTSTLAAREGAEEARGRADQDRREALMSRDQLTKELAELEKSATRVSAESAGLHARRTQLEGQLKEVSTALATRNAELAQASEMLSEVEARRLKAEKALADLEGAAASASATAARRAQSAREDLEELRSSFASLTRAKEGLEKQVAALDAALVARARAETKLADQERLQIEERLATLRAERTAKERELEEWVGKVTEAKGRLGALEERHAQLSKAVAELEVRHGPVKDQPPAASVDQPPSGQ